MAVHNYDGRRRWLPAGENQAQKREKLQAPKKPKNGARTSRPVHAVLSVFLYRFLSQGRITHVPESFEQTIVVDERTKTTSSAVVMVFRNC